ncbi:MAG: response regulator [bacterium]
MLSVLLIDDELAICELMYDFLNRKGYRIRTSQSGKEVFRLIDAEKPDIIFLDLMMPDMTGEDILMRIKKDYPDIPVIIITALNDSKKAIELLVQGASDYLTKPFDLFYIEKYLSTWEELSDV